MYTLIISQKISFLGVCNVDYIYVTIKNGGISISRLNRQEFAELSSDLPIYQKYSSGSIYTSEGFKDYVNNHPALKRALIQLIQENE